MIRLATILALTATSVAAQEPDCTNQTTQLDLNLCAQADFVAADAALNAAYQSALTAARDRDKAGPRGIEDKLREAQRAWIPFRDAACETEALIYEGGSIAPLVQLTCMTQLTLERTEGLIRFLGND